MGSFIYASDFAGYDPTGATDSRAAIIIADAAARAAAKTLVIDGHPRILSTIELDAPTSWLMQGQQLMPGLITVGSVIQKDDSLNGPAIHIKPGAYGSRLEGVALLGDRTKNGGDGFYVEAPGVELINCSVQGMGQDGCRIGSTATGTQNANSFRLANLRSGLNGRDGLHIEDAGGLIDANCGFVDEPLLTQNGRHGLYIKNAGLGNTIATVLAEANSGYGIFLDSGATQNLFLGGDVEANVTGDYFEQTPFANSFFDVAMSGVRKRTFLENGNFVPNAIGSTTTGTASFASRRGKYSIVGRRVHFDIELEWTAHSGAGELRVNGLPFLPENIDGNIPNFVPMNLVYSVALPAGSELVAGYNHNINQILFWRTSAGVRTPLALPPSGTLYISGSYVPNFPA